MSAEERAELERLRAFERQVRVITDRPIPAGANLEAFEDGVRQEVAILAAVLAEREACARALEDFARQRYSLPRPYMSFEHDTARELAALIRARAEP